MPKKILYSVFIFSILFFLLYAAGSLNLVQAATPRAVNGQIDLHDWNWEEQGIISLNGQWEFYWQQLYTPEDFKKIQSAYKNYITLPRAWNKYNINHKELSGDGFATYRLLIQQNSNQVLGIKIPRIFTSYQLWINGKLTASAGKVGKTKEQTVPQYLPQVKYFNPANSTIELVIQVTNFKHRSGGILESIQLGTANRINGLHTRNLALELFLFGSLFIIGFYHLALFIFRTKDKTNLYFGIYALLISARTLLVGPIFFIHLFPRFNWEIAHKIQTLAYYLGVPLVILFLEATFPRDTLRRVNLFIKALASLFAILVILTPVRVFSLFNPIYQIFSLCVILYALYIVGLTIIRRRDGSYLVGIGVTILILCTVNDIIFLSIFVADSSNHFLRRFVTRGDLSSWGLLIFVFAQSLVLAKKFSQSFSKVEILSSQLRSANVNLEEKVRERTLALENSKNELAKAYQAVSRSEKSLQDLMQNISHDLRTPLSAIKGYVNAILDDIVGPTQQKRYLTRVNDKVEHLNHMVQELLDLSQLQSRQVKLQFVAIPVKSLVNTFAEKYSLDLVNSRVAFNIHYPSYLKNSSKKTPAIFVKVNQEKLERVFSNLLNNAEKYTGENSRIDLNFEITADQKKLLIEISDNGIGIPAEDLPHIFDRFYTVSKARHVQTSNGLGLAIVKEIVEYHEGQIWVESTPGEGSQFFFTLPLYRQEEINSSSAETEIEEV